MLRDRQIVLPSIARAVGGLNPSLLYTACPFRVKLRPRRTPSARSAVPLSTDIVRLSRHVRKVPNSEVEALA